MLNKFSTEALDFQKVLKLIEKYCITDIAKEQILNLTPSDDISKIELTLKQIDEAKNVLIDNKILPLNYFDDILLEVKQSSIEGLVLSQKAILTLSSMLISVRAIKTFYKNNVNYFDKLKFQFQLLDELQVVKNGIDKVFDNNGNIRNDASEELRDIRNAIQDKTIQLNKVIQRIIHNLQKDGVLRDTSPSINDGRLVLPVKAEHKRKIVGFIHSESATGQTVYIEPAETLNLNNEILSLKFEEQREIERILRNLTKFISQYANAIILNIEVLSYLDSIFARAKFSIEYECNNVVISNKGNLKILNGRHPLLLAKLGKKDTVPFNLVFENKKVIVITGPNAGGKSVLLKAVGLLVLMLQSGIHVPASPDSEFCIFEKVLVDIGDKQSIEEDLSTFSSHLYNIKNIIENTNDKTLVLIDELGTGTDPEEGSAIGLATLVELRDRGGKVLATTHLGKIKVIANELEGFENSSMQFDMETLNPNYNFMQGIPGSSFAISLVQKTIKDDKFLKLVQEFLDDKKFNLEKMIANLQLSYQEYVELNNKQSIELSKYKALEDLYNKKIKEIEKQKKEILINAKKEIKEYIYNIKKQIEKEISEIRKSEGDKLKIKEARVNIDKVVEKFNSDFKKVTEKEKIENYEFNVGDYVQIQDSQTYGEIINLNSSKNLAEILVNDIKMKVETRKLKPAKKADISNFNKSAQIYIKEDYSYRIDLRGKRLNEIDNLLINFLDDAYSMGLEKVEILHGKGTGALKERVKQILKDQPYIKNFYFAPLEAGGDGITIAELK
jgi:DNA mismatch repair protein MutS2